MFSNSLNYEIHQQRQLNYVKTLLLVRTHRFSESIYKQFMRILKNTFKKPNETFHLKKKKYYNLMLFITRSRENIFINLLKCLNDSNFIIKVRYMYIKNEHNVFIKKVLQQIVLINNYQKTLVKRFISGFYMQNNATFNINVTKLLLFITMGVINTNQSFLAAFSFSIQESKISYNFFFETCKDVI